MFNRIILAFFLLCPCVTIGAEKQSSVHPFIVVYAKGQQPVENVTVAITNPYKDKAILITSVEFEGQLPELRYFYHGIYGSIDKKGNNYEHFHLHQVLSRPVGTCFLLPGQSVSWKRPMRVLADGYKVEVIWQEISNEDVSKTIWFQSQSKIGTDIYEPLLEDKHIQYRNRTAANNVLPRIVLEGGYANISAEYIVSCIDECGNPIQKRNAPKEFTGEGIEYSLAPISESVVLSDNKVVFRKYNMESKGYELSSSPDISAIEVDFIYLCIHSEEKIIPCFLDPNEFADIIEVQRPSFNAIIPSYKPGITKVPIKIFRRIIDRAQERNISIVLRRIDINSLGRQLVLTIGVEVNDNGRWQ